MFFFGGLYSWRVDFHVVFGHTMISRVRVLRQRSTLKSVWQDILSNFERCNFGRAARLHRTRLMSGKRNWLDVGGKNIR